MFKTTLFIVIFYFYFNLYLNVFKKESSLENQSNVKGQNTTPVFKKKKK